MSVPHYLKDGFVRLADLEASGLIPTEERMRHKMPVAEYECIQEIPCNACLLACKFDAVEMKNINDIPRTRFDKCNGCLACIRVCPGLAVFMLQVKEDKGYITMQYEFIPQPKVGDSVITLNREGKPVGRGLITRAVSRERNDGTALVTVEVPKDAILEVRAIKLREKSR